MSKRPARNRRGTTVEDLTKTMREKGVKVRMRVVIEIEVPEDKFARDEFNATVVEWAQTLENFDSGGDGEVVLLTTEELPSSGEA